MILRGAGRRSAPGWTWTRRRKPKWPSGARCGLPGPFRLWPPPLGYGGGVHWAAYAGGAGLMACCDLIVAADDLRICFPEVRRGLVPALAAAAPALRDGDLRELLLLAEPIDARRALAWAWSIAWSRRTGWRRRSDRRHDSQGGPQAVRQTKRCSATRAAEPAAFPRALEFHKQARSDEAREGLAAFRQRRQPHWPPV